MRRKAYLPFASYIDSRDGIGGRSLDDLESQEAWVLITILSIISMICL